MLRKREHKVYGLLCVGCGRIHYIAERCKRSDSCSRCNGLWIRSLYRKFFHRWAQIANEDRVTLWTLGTSLVDSDANRRLLTRRWSLFRMRMNKVGGWEPLFKVVEAGSKGRRLHVHLMVRGFLDHSLVMSHWRAVTGERANVNYSSVESDDVQRHLSYLVKYMVKQRTTYSWLGPMYHAEPLKKGSGSTCRACGDELHFMGESYQILTGKLKVYEEIINTLDDSLLTRSGERITMEREQHGKQRRI